MTDPETEQALRYVMHKSLIQFIGKDNLKPKEALRKMDALMQVMKEKNPKEKDFIDRVHREFSRDLADHIQKSLEDK